MFPGSVLVCGDLLEFVNGHNYLACLCTTEMLTVMLGEGPSQQLCWSGLDAYLGEEHAAGFLRGAFILFDHPRDPGDLPCDVEIVRAILGTRFEGLEGI